MNKLSNIGYRPTWAEVNLGNLAHNFGQIKKILGPGVKVMSCVKADAYGHGLIPVAKKLAVEGADYFGVASIDEGVKLRQAKINLPILVLGVVFEKDAQAFIKYRLTPTVCSEEVALALNKAAIKAKKHIAAHIKVDTGMGRLGVLHADAVSFIKKIHRLKFIKIEGVFTHLSSADTDRHFTQDQIRIFKKLISDLAKENIDIPLFHAANSMGIIGYKESHFNMARPGLALYGLHPKPGLGVNLKPVLSLRTQVVNVKRVPLGWGISYGRSYLAKKSTNIVVLPIGYGDGYPRNLSNLGPVLINGKRFRISGRICMDQIMVDVGDSPVKVGTEVVLIGKQKNKSITSEELAKLAGTISYEIVCGLGSRIPRVVSGGGFPRG